ncbi:TPA: phage major capsid protein, P2 family [Salmonella enterica subsp. enterica serovar Paratyphi B]|uniref:Phage major capsid protein, P2 family n=2 Tax=Salmonella enterica TaxID=28901 RepID=A0A759VYI1_SALER|nr:phage major capsid protein, P2 family [Salmonella enterica subsp. enterica]ECU7777475.1 phage major capsid protein, P2 family [Salmonella enterica subsp. enterica serovar Abony]EDR3091636.1 phage major capsid protein, P2 family [Salmonella enterica subsp. enterica serovar Reading]HAG2197006.1 phage major capsid protein, P2 family [Salmonella enterica]HCM8947441.1 phage major capsid protein, P2 family [Salmonella enterica subsp. enterica serovar Java]HCM8951831.1 phage major capsid protein, 
MQLTPKAEAMLRKFTAGLARANGQVDTSRFFSLTDPKETQLRNALLQNSEFLSLLPNVLDVDQVTGQVVSTGKPGIYTGRKKEGRFSRPLGVDGNEYQLRETDSGSYLAYSLLVVWANAGSEEEFFQRIQAFSNESFALDMLRVAFNGTSAAENTDPEANPNGEDVNIGWHQIVKTRSKEQVITDAVTIGGVGADFIGLDAAVTDLVHSCIYEPMRNDPRLVVLASADLIGADTTTMMNRIDRPTEKVAAQLIGRQIAGRTVYTPPFMPEGRLIVTTLDNLHIYTQRGTRKRKAEWNDDRKRFENNYLRMEGYAVEHDELYAAFDKITLKADVTAPEGGA